MRYIHVPQLEHFESHTLPLFGHHYQPFGSVSVADDTIVRAPGLHLLELEGQTLAIQPDTVSWAFVTQRERQVLADLQNLHASTVGGLRQQWPTEQSDSLDSFVAALFRRGLVTLDGHTAVSTDVFRRGHNSPAGHLVEILLTERCNLACGYCLAGAKTGMPTMNADVGRRTIDLAFSMREAPSLTFEFAGGEPFLRFELLRELSDYARGHPARDGRPVHLCVQTNGTLLNEARVRWLVDNEVEVGVSLDGTPASHNVSRPLVNGRESFSLVMRGLDLLQKHGVSFGILVVLNRSNVANPQELLDFMSESDLRSLKLNAIAYLGTGRENWHTLGLSQDEVIAYVCEFMHRLVDQGHLIKEANIATMLEYWVSKCRTDRCLRSDCEAGETFQTINPEGDIYPCGRSTQSPDLVLGNVLFESDSLSAAGQRSEVLEIIRERNPDALDGCRICHYRQLCQSGCAVQAWESYGTLRHKTPECAFFKNFYPELIRWVCFDERALTHFSHCDYFRAPASLFAHDYLDGPPLSAHTPA